VIGKVIADYKIIEKIGQGGMGEVYKAVHTKLEQTVAIKVLSSEYCLNPSMRKRFVNEARIQAKFSHPNMVNIFNLIEQDSNVFIVMEYINGGTLEKHLERKGILSQDESTYISLQVLSALQFMHSKGVVHRDIKPSNIMFTDTGVVKVTDFGIAKVMNEATKHTKTGMLGSVVYVSPEQILGEKTSVTTDIYSFGITLYRMVTGRVPFRGNSEFVVMQGHLKEKPISPIKFNQNISKSLNKIILKSISKDPEKRYSSVFELIQSLKNVNKKDSIFSNVTFYLNDKIENVSNLGSRNLIVLFLGFVLSIAVLNFAIAKISNNKSHRNKDILKVDNNPVALKQTDTGVANNLNDKIEDKMVFENKYVIFESEEDLSKLNNVSSTEKSENIELDEKKDKNSKNTKKLSGSLGRYTKTQKRSTPEFKKVYYKPKKNKIAEKRSQKKWRIRK
jgi:serine/threonine protein kinase